MLKIASFDVVFQEIPGEVTLALNLSNCPCHCPGCHSPHLADDIGEELTETLMNGLIDRYGSMITCVCFMGGDAEPEEVVRWAEYIKSTDRSADRIQNTDLKTAWYSGRMNMPAKDVFDYVKLGGYVEALGGLKSPTTNQRLYKRVGESWEDITPVFWQKRFE